MHKFKKLRDICDAQQIKTVYEGPIHSQLYINVLIEISYTWILKIILNQTYTYLSDLVICALNDRSQI